MNTDFFLITFEINDAPISKGLLSIFDDAIRVTLGVGRDGLILVNVSCWTHGIRARKVTIQFNDPNSAFVAEIWQSEAKVLGDLLRHFPDRPRFHFLR